MRSTFAIWTCSLVACGKGAPETVLPPVVASMDYVSQSLVKSHTCMDIYDAGVVEGWSAFCKKLHVCTMRRGQACEVSDHHGGCLQRDGSITWLIAGETSCVFGKSFSGESPPRDAVAPYHCKGPVACQEMTSVFDLVATVEAKNCATGGGTFAAGPCPSEGAVGRCRVEGDVDRSVLVLYAPATPETAKQRCAMIKGEWL